MAGIKALLAINSVNVMAFVHPAHLIVIQAIFNKEWLERLMLIQSGRDQSYG
jgi:hypothetical protein